MTNIETFRIGCIGQINTKNIKDLVGCIDSFIKKIKLRFNKIEYFNHLIFAAIIHACWNAYIKNKGNRNKVVILYF